MCSKNFPLERPSTPRDSNPRPLDSQLSILPLHVKQPIEDLLSQVGLHYKTTTRRSLYFREENNKRSCQGPFRLIALTSDLIGPNCRRAADFDQPKVERRVRLLSSSSSSSLLSTKPATPDATFN